MGLNDRAWEQIFEKYHILKELSDKGSFSISANQIKEFREPRLMTKFDHRVNLPKIFLDNGLAILPVTRGDYVISSFEAYREFEEPSGDVRRVSIPAYLQSLMPQFLVSEAISLNCAHACGILGDFLEDEAIVPTVSGRMGSGDFAFDINTASGVKRLTVSNSQIEIDAAYEGIHSLSLFEAKRDLSDDFLVRQLYYPFCVWSRRVAKPVKPVFLIFSNGIFCLYQYRFAVPGSYNSLELVKQRNYMIEAEIALADLEGLLNTACPIREPDIPFPQANSMARLINLIELLHAKPMTKDEITSRYGFDSRQTNYYTDAGRYLELMEKDRDSERNIIFRLSPLGRRIMKMPYRERQLALAAQVLRHRAFKDTLKLRLQCGGMPDAAAIVRIMKDADLYHVDADSTYYRRSSTITGWVNWMLGLIGER